MTVLCAVLLFLLNVICKAQEWKYTDSNCDVVPTDPYEAWMLNHQGCYGACVTTAKQHGTYQLDDTQQATSCGTDRESSSEKQQTGTGCGYIKFKLRKGLRSYCTHKTNYVAPLPLGSTQSKTAPDCSTEPCSSFVLDTSDGKLGKVVFYCRAFAWNKAQLSIEDFPRGCPPGTTDSGVRAACQEHRKEDGFTQEYVCGIDKDVTYFRSNCPEIEDPGCLFTVTRGEVITKYKGDRSIVAGAHSGIINYYDALQEYYDDLDVEEHREMIAYKQLAQEKNKINRMKRLYGNAQN